MVEVRGLGDLSCIVICICIIYTLDIYRISQIKITSKASAPLLACSMCWCSSADGQPFNSSLDSLIVTTTNKPSLGVDAAASFRSANLSLHENSGSHIPEEGSNDNAKTPRGECCPILNLSSTDRALEGKPRSHTHGCGSYPMPLSTSRVCVSYLHIISACGQGKAIQSPTFCFLFLGPIVRENLR